MKQENMYIYQWLFRLCYVPIIALKQKNSFKKNELRRLSLSRYNLFLRDSMITVAVMVNSGYSGMLARSGL